MIHSFGALTSYMLALIFATMSSVSALIVPVPPSCSASSSCLAALSAAFTTCAEARMPCTIALGAGVYALSAVPQTSWLQVTAAEDVAVVGAGPAATTLLAADLAHVVTLFRVRNVSFRELSLDMVRPPFTLAHVQASAAGVSTLSFDGGAYPIDESRFPWLSSCQAILQYNVSSGRPARGGVDDYFLPPAAKSIAYSGAAPAQTMSIPVPLPVGADVIVRHQVYSMDAFTAVDSDAIALHNVTLLAAGGMGLLCSNVSGIDLDGFRIVKAAGRPMSITADGFHSSNSRGGAITVRRSVFEGQGDDGINVPTIYSDIESISADRRTLTTGKDGALGDNFFIFVVGATLNFFNRSSLLPLGTGVIAALAPPATVTLAAPLPAAVSLYDLVNNAGAYADYVEITDSLFKDNRARGALLKSSNVFCARNVFDHCTGAAIKTETDGCYWFEGHPVQNWTVTNNTFLGNNFATAACAGDVYVDNAVPTFAGGVPTTTCHVFSAQPVHSGLTITDNVFVLDAGQSAVYAYAAAGIDVSRNVVTRTAGPAPAAGDLVGIGCTGTSAAGNTCNGGACAISGL